MERSGLLCVWFYFPEAGENRGPRGDALRAALAKEIGAFFDGGGNTQLIFSIPVVLGFPRIESVFNRLVEERPGSSWLFGNVYDAGNNFEPIGWWD